MIPARITFFVLVSVLVYPAAIAQAASAHVELTKAQQQKMGVAVAPLMSVTLPATEGAYAAVVDVSPLAALASEVAAARAAASASRTQANRLARLAAQDQSASRQSVEAAEAAAKSDEARLALAQRRIGLEWGPAFARLSWNDLNRLLGQIATGDVALVRIDGVHSTGAAPKQALLRDRSGVPLTTVTILGIAATADPRFQTPGLFALAKGQAAASLRPGRVLAAEVADGAAIAGVVLPRTALVRIDAATWAYVQTDSDGFDRRPVLGARQVEQGWIVMQGFEVGDKIVVNGAGALIAAEHGAETKEAD